MGLPTWAIATVLLASTAVEQAPAELRAVPWSEVTELVASSERNAKNRAEMVRDGILWTAWLSDPVTADAPPTLTMGFPTTRYITKIQLMGGWAKDNKTFRRHARPKVLTVKWDGGEQRFELEDHRESQDLDLRGLAQTRTLTLRVDAVYGNGGRGVAISELWLQEPADVLEVDDKLRVLIEQTVGKLGHPKLGAEARQQVVRYGRPVIPWLRDKVTRGEEAAATAALDAMLELGGAEADAALSDQLRHTMPWRVLMGLAAQEKHRRAAANDALVIVARTQHLQISTRAIRLLAEAADPRALSYLEEQIASQHGDRMILGADLLHRFGDEGLNTAEKLLGHSAPLVRMTTLMALGRFSGSARAVEMLAARAMGPNEDEALAAIDALTRIQAPGATALLGKLLRTAAPERRLAACVALLNRDDDGLNTVIRALDSRDFGLTAVIFEAMAQVRAARVRGQLVAWVFDGGKHYDDATRALARHGAAGVNGLIDRMVRAPSKIANAQQFLRTTAGAAAPVCAKRLPGLDPARYLDPVRAALIGAIRQAKATDHADVLLALYDHEKTTSAIKRTLLEAFGDLPTEAVKDRVMRELDSDEDSVSLIAQEMAARLGDKRAGQRIMAELRETNPEDWSPVSVKALGKLGDDETLKLFKWAYLSTHRQVKVAILEASFELGGRDAVQLLVDGYAGADPAVRRAADRLLSQY